MVVRVRGELLSFKLAFKLLKVYKNLQDKKHLYIYKLKALISIKTTPKVIIPLLLFFFFLSKYNYWENKYSKSDSRRDSSRKRNTLY